MDNKKKCGFKADHRTDNILFILNTLFNSYVVNKNHNVYIAFVDFSKFFDTINRDMLLYKLLRYGITRPIYDIIKSMYRNIRYVLEIRYLRKSVQIPGLSMAAA